jgi:integrase
VRDFIPEDLSEFISSRRKRVCANSVNADLRILRAVLRLAVDEEIIRELPFKVRMLRATPREVVLLSRADVLRLLNASDDPRIRLLSVVPVARVYQCRCRGCVLPSW